MCCRCVRSSAEYSDVTLAGEDGKAVQAHRVILASSSTFFKQVLHLH